MKHSISEITVSYLPTPGTAQVISTAADALPVFATFFPKETMQLQERFVVMYLNKGNRVIGMYTVSVGGITGTVADIRLILGVALKTAATGLILGHNHPSGNLKPSAADVDLTRKTVEAGKLMDIKVLDHLILAPQSDSYYSFAEEGIL